MSNKHLRLCAHEVVSERFHNSQNENDMNCKISHRTKFLVFVIEEVDAGFHKIMSTSRELFERIRNENA